MQVVDIFSLDFGSLLERPAPIQGGELDTSLMLYLAPDLVRMDLAQDFELTPGMLARYRPGHSRHLPRGSPGSVGYPEPRIGPERRGPVYIYPRTGRPLPDPVLT